MSFRVRRTSLFAHVAAAVCGGVLLFGATRIAAESSPQQSPLIVHEWGTFTSVAGQDGRAVEWLPLDGPSDLPCFVLRFGFSNFKTSTPALVRMETPVLYFYGAAGTAVDVKVRFNQGVVTEWFPPAAVTPASSDVKLASLYKPEFSSSISWSHVTLSDRKGESFPTHDDGSHYYVARRPNAMPLDAGNAHEKFLFYRGVGGFQPPISATLTRDGHVAVTSTSGEPLGDVILFENRHGSMNYQVVSASGRDTTLGPLTIDGEFVAPVAELERILVARGLFSEEAKAMVDTWRDSWFEEGARLFYIAPRPSVDAILPLDINPPPSGVVRVFVGRMELETATTRREIETALARQDRPTLVKYGRFLQPFASQIIAAATPDSRKIYENSLRQLPSPPPQANSCR